MPPSPRLAREETNEHAPTAPTISGTLHSLAEAGKVAELRWYLSEHSMGVNDKDFLGRTMLYLAAFRGHSDCVTLLLSCGADCELARPDGLAPLYMASWAGHPECVRVLLSVRADVNRQNSYGRTPLWIACKFGPSSSSSTERFDCVRQLLAAGADATIASSWPVGVLPVAMAHERHDQQLVSLLESGKALALTPLPSRPLAEEPHTWARQLLGETAYQADLSLAVAGICRARSLGASPETVRALEAEMEAAKEAIGPARQGVSCTFWLLDADAIRADESLTTLPSWQELRRSERRSWLRRVTLTFEGACASSRGGTSILAVSHRWDTPTAPDPDGVQYAEVRRFLLSHREITDVFYDAACCPQSPRTEGEEREFGRLLPNINLLYLGSKVPSAATITPDPPRRPPIAADGR